RGAEGQSLKDLLKDLKNNNKSHRWLAVLDKAAQINHIVKKMHTNEYIDELKKGRTDTLKEFYFTDQDTKGKSIDMENIKSIIDPSKEAKLRDLLIKEALFGDISRKVTDKFLSNFYDKKEREVRRAMNNLTSRAETLAVRAIDAYKQLDSAR